MQESFLNFSYLRIVNRLIERLKSKLKCHQILILNLINSLVQLSEQTNSKRWAKNIFSITCQQEDILNFRGIQYHLKMNLKAERVLERQNRRSCQSQGMLIYISSASLRIEIPKHWTVNKLKCLLVSEVPKIDFDKFELKHRDRLLEGTHLVGEIGEENQSIVQLEVFLIDAKQKFAEYYTNTMKPFLSDTYHENFPLFSPDYQKTFRKIQYQEPEREMNNEEIINNDIQNQQPALLRGLRLFGLYLMLGMIITFARAYQIGLILFVLTVYGIIQYLKIKNNPRRNFIQQREAQAQSEPDEKENERQNQGSLLEESSYEGKNERSGNQSQSSIENFEQQIEGGKRIRFENKIIAICLLVFFKTCEIVICFLLTFFPNWTIEIHLQMNAIRIEECKKIIENLEPNIFKRQKLKEE